MQFTGFKWHELFVPGVEEGQRYVEKTMKKHCEIVASIRELSRQLVELEAKLKVMLLCLSQSKFNVTFSLCVKKKRKKDRLLSHRDTEH